MVVQTLKSRASSLRSQITGGRVEKYIEQIETSVSYGDYLQMSIICEYFCVVLHMFTSDQEAEVMELRPPGNPERVSRHLFMCEYPDGQYFSVFAPGLVLDSSLTTSTLSESSPGPLRRELPYEKDLHTEKGRLVERRNSDRRESRREKEIESKDKSRQRERERRKELSKEVKEREEDNDEKNQKEKKDSEERKDEERGEIDIRERIRERKEQREKELERRMKDKERREKEKEQREKEEERQREAERLREEREQRERQEEIEKKKEIERQKEAEIERQKQRQEMERQKEAEMERRRKIEEIERQKQMEEMERQRKIDEMERQRKTEEMERRRKIEEMERRKQMEEMERKKQMEEMERQRKLDLERQSGIDKVVEGRGESDGSDQSSLEIERERRRKESRDLICFLEEDYKSEGGPIGEISILPDDTVSFLVDKMTKEFDDVICGRKFQVLKAEMTKTQGKWPIPIRAGQYTFVVSHFFRKPDDIVLLKIVS
eukprot:TRINITY_DN527_c0_g1_i6.p1 TRINITY_DN527_c0_g1~~TRINITY_DN527_c0_g1_i6.p1  ORF type:complete len:491 (+),score=153.04 TRINITY_DN527_c0_g1_i6:198-1670(+)